MKSVSAQEMKKLDALAIARYGIPAIILMENAGRSAAQEALKMLPKKGIRRVALFCGYGNNGGDGFVCARHLINQGIQARIYLVGEKKQFSRETKLNYQILSKLKQKFEPVKNSKAFGKLTQEIKKCQLIIDGIFGIGLKGGLNQFYQELFSTLNSAQAPILSLDIPSGLDADTGKPLGGAIQAVKTITFGLLKKGLIKPQACKFTGKITVADISLPTS